MTQVEQNLEAIKLEVVGHLWEIQEQCKEWGLEGIDKFTLIARDPTQDSMIVVVTNDDLGDAFHAALTKAESVS